MYRDVLERNVREIGSKLSTNNILRIFSSPSNVQAAIPQDLTGAILKLQRNSRIFKRVKNFLIIGRILDFHAFWM